MDLKSADKNCKYGYTSRSWYNQAAEFCFLKDEEWWFSDIMTLEPLSDHNLQMDDYFVNYDILNPAYKPKVSLKEIYATY